MTFSENRRTMMLSLGDFPKEHLSLYGYQVIFQYVYHELVLKVKFVSKVCKYINPKGNDLHFN